MGAAGRRPAAGIGTVKDGLPVALSLANAGRVIALLLQQGGHGRALRLNQWWGIPASPYPISSAMINRYSEALPFLASGIYLNLDHWKQKATGLFWKGDPGSAVGRLGSDGLTALKNNGTGDLANQSVHKKGRTGRHIP